MSNEALVPITDDDLPDTFTRDMDADRLVVRRPPAHVLDEAQQAASALKRVIDGKPKPVRYNGETYLEFEDWQTCGRFYGVTAKVLSTEYVDYGGAQGFVARAEAIRADGVAISAAESMCLNDEPNWAKKPLYQLRSMAQTRACAKALRNVLAWVVVLAGYKPTPAEEMDGVRHEPARGQGSAPEAAASDRGAPPAQQRQAGAGDTISEAQGKRFWAIAKGAGNSDDSIRDLLARFGLEHTRDIPKSMYDEICAEAKKK